MRAATSIVARLKEGGIVERDVSTRGLRQELRLVSFDCVVLEVRWQP